MTPLFQKLNLKDQAEILVVNAPESFEAELEALEKRTIRQDIFDAEEISFALVFVTQQQQLDDLATAIAAKTQGDAVIWFAYPKMTSKKYQCDFNRDMGWATLGTLGFEGVRQVSIDADWSALRFRRVELIKTMTRDRSRALTDQGKARVSKP